MRRIIYVVCVLMLCGSAWGANYPDIGVCENENVMLREFPSARGKVGGYMFVGQQLVILGEKTLDGRLWYRIDHPTRKGIVWITAEDVSFLYDGQYTDPDFVRVRMTFGVNHEKTRLLFGKPVVNATASTLEYDGLKLWYKNDNLRKVEVSRAGLPIAGIQTGDRLEKLYDLGMPADFPDTISGDVKGWERETDSGEKMFFRFGVNNAGRRIVDWMSWERP